MVRLQALGSFQPLIMESDLILFSNYRYFYYWFFSARTMEMYFAQENLNGVS